MNIVLWVLQVLLALHTAMGAVWRFTNSEQNAPTLGALPHGVWLATGVAGLIASVALILPALNRRLGYLAPLAAGYVVLEMLVFCAVHLASGAPSHGPMVYWLVVAAVSAFVGYGRLALKPIAPMPAPA
jgi:hypothetical protein